MDPAALEGGHRLELKHLAGLDDAGRGPFGEVAQLALTPATVIFDVDEDTGPGPHLLREHQVHEVLERGQALALATDQGAEGFSLVAVADDVQAAGLAGLDLDADVEPEVDHELLEDRLQQPSRGACGLGLRAADEQAPT
jgi:hypothetical protein